MTKSVDDVKVRFDGKRGVWCCRLYLGRNKVTGRPWRPHADFPDAQTEEEALAAAREWYADVLPAANLHASMATSDLLLRFIDAKRYAWAPNTLRTYRNCERWTRPYIGGVRADALTATDIEDMYGGLMESGGKSGGLASNTVMRVHMFLRKAFKWLVRAGVLDANPLDDVDKPPSWTVEPKALSEASLDVLKSELAARMADGSTGRGNFWRRTCAFAAYLALNTGMRVGEVCALRLDDVSRRQRMLTVCGTVVEVTGEPPRRQERPKGKKSRNVQIGPNAMAAIEEHLEWQLGILPRKAALDGSRTLVCKPDGGIVRPSTVSHKFHEMAGELGMPAGTTFHTLRHTHATFALTSEGGDFRTVQERLGHSDPATTIRLYSHVVPGRDAMVAAETDEIMGGSR